MRKPLNPNPREAKSATQIKCLPFNKTQIIPTPRVNPHRLLQFSSSYLSNQHSHPPLDSEVGEMGRWECGEGASQGTMSLQHQGQMTQASEEMD